MIAELSQQISHYLTLHPHVASIMTFLIAASESIAVVGAVIPGSVTMTAIGILVGNGTLSGVSTYFWAILGAILGDWISYWIGYRYHAQIRNIWPFRNHQNLLDKGEAFFRKHGGKSVIIGRFFGPMRNLTPLIAGVLRMPRGRFLLAMIPSAIAWAILYLTPGVMIGTASQHLPKHLATKVILSILGVIVVVWLVSWLMKLTYQKLSKLYGKAVDHIWTYCQQHAFLKVIPNTIRNAFHPMHYQPLSLLFSGILSAFFFLCILYEIHTNGIVLILNPTLHQVLQHLANETTTTLMEMISQLGYVFVILDAVAIILLWLIIKKNYWVAGHLAILTLGSSAIIAVLKKFIYSPRPEGAAIISDTSSFPSGHVTLSTAVFFFLAYVIAQYLSKPYRNIPYLIASVCVFLIICSRLYLGMHWFTDILAGILLGITCYIPVILSMQHRRYHPVEVKSFITIVSLSLFFSWLLGIWFL